MKAEPLHISVVIPTCDRRDRLLRLLRNLQDLSYPLAEVIVVDAGKDRLAPGDYSGFNRFQLQYISSEKSVCVQRNLGIRLARHPWVFLCDDDVELPGDYIDKLVAFALANPEAGAISGLWMELQQGEWKATHPESNLLSLLWKHVFRLGMWGEIECKGRNFLGRRLKRYYARKGNFLTKAGWPVNTDFRGNATLCPVYSLGASLVKKEWLVQSPFDEVLDRHGIGDNYGVIMGFPEPGVHVITTTSVKHHLDVGNRLHQPLRYYRRILALDYFGRKLPALKHFRRRSLVWSLVGNLVQSMRTGDRMMMRATWKAIVTISMNANPYTRAGKRGEKLVEPRL